MLTAILALLNAIPAFAGIVNSITTGWFNAKVQIVQAKTGADRDVAVALVKAAATEAHERTAALGVIAGNYLLTILVVAFAAPFAGYINWIIFHDILWCGGQCATDPIKGQVAEWGNTIIAFVFGAPTAVTVGKMWFARKID